MVIRPKKTSADSCTKTHQPAFPRGKLGWPEMMTVSPEPEEHPAAHSQTRLRKSTSFTSEEVPLGARQPSDLFVC